MDNRLSHEDVMNKLDKYRKINRQLSNELAAKRLKIAELENRLTETTSDMDYVRVRDECLEWKCMALKIRDMYQTPSTDILDAMITGMDDFLAMSARSTLKHTKKRRKKSERKFIAKNLQCRCINN